MSARFATRFLPALMLGALAWTTPAVAHDRYDSEYDHYLRDRYEAQQHRQQDRSERLGHAIGDLFRYGTTDPYSSPEHYYRDRQREREHYFRDRDRALEHYERDRWGRRWSGDHYDWNSGDYRHDDYLLRGNRDHRR